MQKCHVYNLNIKRLFKHNPHIGHHCQMHLNVAHGLQTEHAILCHLWLFQTSKWAQELTNIGMNMSIKKW